jgi:hypothetical protein
VSGGITGPPCHWGTKIQGPGLPGRGLYARLTILLCGKIAVALSNDVKTVPNLAESCEKGYGSTSAALPMMMMIL